MSVNVNKRIIQREKTNLHKVLKVCLLLQHIENLA